MRPICASWLFIVTLLATGALAAPGDLDPTFGDGGIVVNDLVGTADDAQAVVVQTDQMLVVAGSAALAGGREFVLWRHSPDGSLDPLFGSGGVVVTSFGPDDDAANDVVVQPDGKIVAVGYVTLPTNVAVAMVRYDSDGNPDASFGFSGLVTTLPLGGSARAYAVALQSDGKILVAGARFSDVLLLRYDDGGTLDPTFGMGGVVTLHIDASGQEAHDVLVQPDGKIVVGGQALAGPSFLVARFEDDGTPDATFGTGGYVTTSFPSPIFGSVVNGLALQTDGAIVAAGQGRGTLTTYVDTGVVRYTAGGVLDPTFGSGGRVDIDYDLTSDFAEAVVLQPDGKIVVGGPAYDVKHEDREFALSRLRPDGTLDSTFGAGGSLMSDLSGEHDELRDLALQADGKIVAAGRVLIDGVTHVGVVRYEAVALACAPAPLAGCRTAVVAGKGRLKLKDKSNDKSDQLLWQWRNGAATTFADYGDPVGSDDYVLCLYDESGPPTLRHELLMAAGGTCGKKVCWTSKAPAQIDYKDKDRTPSGIASLALRPGEDGAASIIAKGKGVNLPPPSLPLPLPMRVQLQGEHGVCWEATYSSAGVVSNDATEFTGASE